MAKKHGIRDQYLREAQLRARIPFLSMRRPLPPPPEVCLLVDNKGRIVRKSVGHPGDRLSQVRFASGLTIHEAIHPECADDDCELLKNWRNAWSAHAAGLPVEWLHLSEKSDAALKLRLQTVDYACNVLFEGKVGEFSGHSIAFVQDIGSSAERDNDVDTARDTYIKNATLYRQRRSSDPDPDLVASMDERLRTMTRRLLTCEADIRASIGAELHDGLGQTLSLMRLEIEALIASHERNDEHATSDGLNRTGVRVKQALRELRDITSGLGTKIPDGDSLRHSLVALCTEFRTLQPDVELELDMVGSVADIPGELGATIYRIAQEALNNIVKHANASLAAISLTADKDGVRLIVSDDGVGLPAEGATRLGLGLITMRERAERLGGSYAANCPTQKGCTIRIDWPPEVITSLR